MVDLRAYVLGVPDGVSTPSGSEFELEEEDGEDEDNKRPDVVQGINSKRRTKELRKPTRDAITQARRALDPATPTAGGKRAREALSDEPSVQG